MAREPAAMELASLGGFALSGGVFAAVLDEGWPRLDETWWGSLVVTGVLVCVALVGRAPGWAITLSCGAFLMSLIAVVPAAYAGRMDPATERALAEPAWWPEFERDFAKYVRDAALREKDGDSGRAS
jgi:hypothetical protein